MFLYLVGKVKKKKKNSMHDLTYMIHTLRLFLAKYLLKLTVFISRWKGFKTIGSRIEVKAMLSFKVLNVN